MPGPYPPESSWSRVGLGVGCMALCPREAEYSLPRELPEDVRLRKENRSLRLYAEAGEKSFALEDSLSGEEGKIVSCTAQCLLTDRKVVGDKLAFRGSAEVQGLFLTEEGAPVSRHFTLPFSQLIQLEKAYGSAGEADLCLCLTDLETESDGEGNIRLKLGIAAQYALSDVTDIGRCTDAYSPRREVKLSWDTVEVCAIVDRRWETVTADTALSEDADNALDLFGMWEEPVWDRTEEGIRLEASGSAQLLYRQGEGLNSALLHWKGDREIPAREDAKFAVTAFQGLQPQPNPAAGQLTGGCTFLLTAFSGSGIPGGVRAGARGAPAEAGGHPVAGPVQSRGAGPVDAGESPRLHGRGHPGGQPIGGSAGKGQNASDPGGIKRRYGQHRAVRQAQPDFSQGQGPKSAVPGESRGGALADCRFCRGECPPSSRIAIFGGVFPGNSVEGKSFPYWAV